MSHDLPSSPHDLVARYVDGELSGEEEAIALTHLAGCAQCQTELGDLIGFEVALQRVEPAPNHRSAPTQDGRPSVSSSAMPAPGQPVRDASAVVALDQARRRTWRRRAVQGGLIGALAAAAALVLVVSRRPPATVPSPQLALAPTRSVEARFSASLLDQYRPYSVTRGASNPERIPLDTLAELQRSGADAAVVAARALGGDLASARADLERLPTSAATESDRAAIELMAGNLEAALEATSRALRSAAPPSAALWNRALVLRELGLPYTAAEIFEAVARRKEPGWATEAEERMRLLRATVAERFTALESFTQAARAMVDRTGPPLTATEVVARPGLTRVYFHDALRSATTAQEALALSPLAEALDQAVGNDLATRAIARVASADFKVRGQLARSYRELALGRATDQGAALLRSLARGPRGTEDLRLGTIVATGNMYDRLDETRSLIQATGDPWFLLLLPLYEGNLLMQQGETDRAEAVLRAGLAGCDERLWAHRCAALADSLKVLYGTQGRYADLESQVEASVRMFRAAGYTSGEDNALSALAEVQRARGRVELAEATFTEARARLRGHYCEGARFAAGGLAMLSVYQRATLEVELKVDDCGQPPSDVEVALLTDLALMTGRPEDRARAEAWIAAARAPGSPELAFVGEVAAARLQAATDPSAPARLRALLPRVAGSDETVTSFRLWIYQTLIDDAGRRGAWTEALELVAANLGVEPATTCTLAVSIDDTRRTTVVRAADGSIYGERSSVPTPADWAGAKMVSEALRKALTGCDQIDVLARPPLHGRADLLPPEVAWSFGGRHTAPPSPVASPRQLFIGDAQPPAALALPALAPMRSPAGAAALRGPLVTPARVLAELATATYAELHVHGQVDLKASDASFLALSPGADERWALTAAEVRKARLTANPVIVLAACRAAKVAPYEHRRWSLPDAFLEAGARAVIAPTVEIPDDEAVQFFAELRQRLARGEAPATALAAVRKVYVERGSAWAGNVILFE